MVGVRARPKVMLIGGPSHSLCSPQKHDRTHTTMTSLTAFQRSLQREALPADLWTNDYFVPRVVQAYGNLVAWFADAQQQDMAPSQAAALTTERYLDLARNVAMLLATNAITEVSEEAVASAKHRWAGQVDAWVALGTRVEALHQAYREGSDELVTNRAEKLWVALDTRSRAITGQTLEKVIA